MIIPDGQYGSNGSITPLIDALASHDGITRQEARALLIKRGHDAVTELIRALRHPQEQVRWEAAKALISIADPAATSALAEALRDEDGDVRWLAAEGLIALGSISIWPVLGLLTRCGDSAELRGAAHHVLDADFDDELNALIAPVVDALEGSSPETAAPVAAYRALYEAGRTGFPPAVGRS